MRKYLCAIGVISGFVTGAFGQSPKYKYEFTRFVDSFPNATGMARDTVSVAADGKGTILVLRRSEPPVLVYNREGKLLNSWGTGLFVDDHNIDVDRFGFVWIGDRNGQMVYKFTIDGKLLMSIGTKSVKGDDTSKTSFNRASDVYVAANGDIFVADGYENHRIVQFDKDGKFIKIIGGIKGRGPGQLDGIHGVAMDSKGRLIVLDHHGDDPRITVWDPKTGKFLEDWGPLNLTMGSGFTMDEKTDTFYVSDTNGHQLISVKEGKVIDRIGGLRAEGHQAVRDSGTGVLYLADTGAEGGMIWKVVISPQTAAARPPMSFFATSKGSGDGANLSGIAGADYLCQTLAEAVGSTKTWHAYLSTRAGDNAVTILHARERIGTGPWYNAKGELIAKNVSDLHGDNNNLNKQTALTEKGETIKGFGDTPNMHDILTGSRPDGTAYPRDDMDHTCYNWTSNKDTGSAQVGHFDRMGGGTNSWNSAHATRGCSQANLAATGGAGLFYCFAVD